MKIALIINDITFSAGTERAATNLANNLSRFHDVTVISLMSVNIEPYYTLNENVKLQLLNLSFTGKIRYYKSFYKYIKKESDNFDVLIGTNHALNIIISFFSKKVKTIGCEHINYASATKSTLFIRKLFYKNLVKLVVLTKQDKDKYIEEDNLNNVEIIPNQLSFEVKEIPKYENKRMIAVGRFTLQKGFDILLDQFHKTIKDNNWELCLIGDGEMRDEILAKIKKYNLSDNINMISNTKDIKGEMLKSSFYIMTSRYEGLPMILLEAQATGLPIIAFDCPTGPSEVVINNQNGFLIERA